MDNEYIKLGTIKERLEDFSQWCRDGRKQGVDFVLDCVLPDMSIADVVEVTHGEWARVSDDDQHEGEYCCSLCSAEEFIPENAIFPPFCWSCGAKMDGGAE